jgi:uncharacterized protein (TIGR01244 family)
MSRQVVLLSIKENLMPDKRMKINDQVTVGAQPSEEEISQLHEEGFQSIVNFRTEGEEEQPLSPDAEGEKVEAAGMKYLSIPVSMKSMTAGQVDQFCRQFKDLPKPIFAHCKSGKRAGAMVMMHVAVEKGMTGDQTLQKAEEMGFECDKEELKAFVKNYVDNRCQSA